MFKEILIPAVGLILLLLIILVLWRKRAQATSSSPHPSTAPPLPVTGPYLESASTADDQHRFGLKPGGITIGRSPENDMIITQDFPDWETVSQRHAWIYQWIDHWIVEDVSSMNGIQVNGRRTRRNLLRDGWQLDIGGVAFVFRETTEEIEQ
ncbi:MAG: FHA domain-containing protein [Chloroflexi bacterium]|nr:FHA domain-containing protein [Chloroflexota bacterium]